jgi:hypothetical protein
MGTPKGGAGPRWSLEELGSGPRDGGRWLAIALGHLRMAWSWGKSLFAQYVRVQALLFSAPVTRRRARTGVFRRLRCRRPPDR